MKYRLTMNAEQVGEIWGCSSWSVYGMVGAGTCPVAPLRLGRKLMWPTAPVLASVGLHFDPATGLAGIGDEPILGSRDCPNPRSRVDGSEPSISGQT